MVNIDPAGLGRVLGFDMPPDTRPGPTELNLAEIHADRRDADMIRVNDDMVIHLEFQHRADPTMADRMLIYYSLLRVEPAYTGKPIQQHVIVLGKGTSPSRIDEPDLTFAFRTHYARNVDPAVALSDPLSAPWATLSAAGDDAEREDRLLKALQLVATTESESLKRDLNRAVLTFATITMKRDDIERALREAGMPADMIRDTEFAQELIDEGLTKGRAEGRAEGALETTINVLQHRGVQGREATMIAEALIHEDPATAATRAAFGDLGELGALGVGK